MKFSLKNIFGKDKTDSKDIQVNNMNWKAIESENDFDAIVTESNDKIVMVFKHSTRCPVSSMAKKMLENGWDHKDADVSSYYLDLIRFRNVSNYIATKSQVMHQSPQMIVFKNEEVIHHSSHHQINANNI